MMKQFAVGELQNYIRLCEADITALWVCRIAFAIGCDNDIFIIIIL